MNTAARVGAWLFVLVSSVAAHSIPPGWAWVAGLVSALVLMAGDHRRGYCVGLEHAALEVQRLGGGRNLRPCCENRLTEARRAIEKIKEEP